MARNYVFGPVASRRLGVSLGVDLVEPKTCSLNCIYCEAKKTTHLTVERQEYAPIATVLAQLDAYLGQRPALDFITFSGSGEPLLNSGIGRVVKHLKTHYPQYKVCLLTNAVALRDPAVWQDIAPIDLVIPSLDASCEAEFQAVNRPESSIKFAEFVDALTRYTQQATNEVHLELFVVPEVNDSAESIARFVELVKPMKLDSIQLNTLDRPGAVKDLHPAPPETLERFVAALSAVHPTSLIRHFRAAEPKQPCANPEQTILELIERRPATAADLKIATGLAAGAVKKILEELTLANQISTREEARGVFYELKNAQVEQ